MNNNQRKQAAIAKLTMQLKVIYNDKYTWDTESYSSTHSRVEGYCNVHKCTLSFTPTSIYRGTVPCKICKGTVDDLSSFIRKAKEIHGNTYTYSNAHYEQYRLPITVTCRRHGDFNQRVSDHLVGKGCNKCGNNIQSQEEIINRFNTIHNDFYDYSKVEYKGMHHKIKIICPKHGEFYQRPSDHIFNLQGCPSCGSSCFSTQKPGTFYILRVIHGSKEYYKIGITNKTLKQRYSSTHDKSRLVKCFVYTFQNGYLAQELEYKLLSYYKNQKANTAILLSGNTEIVTKDIRKDKYFKEIFNEQRNKDTRNV